jgi:tetratricopeptide (TPR) repeat protein
MITILLAGLVGMARAQTIQEGVNHLYADRTKTAKQTFEKIVAANPNNLDAVYWLGQSELEMNDVASADQLYSKTLNANGNAPLILAGQGQVELIKGNKDKARQLFETAINLSSNSKKGPDPAILNAVGRANVQAKDGDNAYAIEKLKLAAEKDPKNADIFLNLGDAYRKVQDGGQAVSAYDKALQANPALARGVYRKGMIYYTQKNWEIYVPLMEQAISIDSKFAPAYYELYYYNLQWKKPVDLGTAQDYANKFIANTEQDPQNDYLRIQTIWAQGQVAMSNGDSTQAVAKFKEAITGAKNLIATVGEQQILPRTYKLIAISSLGVKDTATAKEYIDKYFAKEKQENLVSNDYFVRARIYSNSPANEALVMENYRKGTLMDSVYATKYNNLIDEVGIFKKQQGKKCFEAGVLSLIYQIKKENNKPLDQRDLFGPAFAYFQCGNLLRADSLFKAYNTAYPDSIHGFYWDATIQAITDSTMTLGLAIPLYEKVLTIAETDKVRFKGQGIKAAGYLAGYANNVKKDKAAAISYLERGLAFDPTNAEFLKNKEILSKPPAKTTPPTKTGTAPKQSAATKPPTIKKNSKAVAKK